jgi:hypothetical protein
VLTKKNFKKVIIITTYIDNEENEKFLHEPQDDTLYVALNGYRRNLSDCIAHSDYNIKKLCSHFFTDIPQQRWKKQPILAFRDYRNTYPDSVIDCREYEFWGTTLLTTVAFFVANNIHDILLYATNPINHFYNERYSNLNRDGINKIKEYHPNCNIYKISDEARFDLDVISVKDFYGIHS